MKIALFRLLSFVLATPCAFFTYYTARLVYINLTVTAHRHYGMYIGAFAFPLAAAIFAALSFRCFRAAQGAARAPRVRC